MNLIKSLDGEISQANSQPTLESCPTLKTYAVPRLQEKLITWSYSSPETRHPDMHKTKTLLHGTGCLRCLWSSTNSCTQSKVPAGKLMPLPVLQCFPVALALKNIDSDRSTQFVSHVWKSGINHCRLVFFHWESMPKSHLNIKLRSSTIFSVSSVTNLPYSPGKSIPQVCLQWTSGSGGANKCGRQYICGSSR